MSYTEVVSGTPTLSSTGNGAATSPDGSYVAIAHSLGDHLTIVQTSDWSVVTGTPSVAGAGIDAQFSADGTRLAVVHGSSPYLTIIDTSDWSVVTGTPEPPTTPSGVAYSPSGAHLAVSHTYDKGTTYRVWETATWTRVTVPNTGGNGTDVEFSPNGDWLAVGQGAATPTLVIIQTSDWTVVSGTPDPGGTVDTATFNADSSQVAATHSSSPYLAVIDTATWSLVSGTPTLPASGEGVSFRTDPTLLAVGYGGSSPYISIYDTSTWAAETGIPSMAGPVNALAFTPDDTYLVSAHAVSPFMTVLEAPIEPTMHITLEDTSVSASGTVDPILTMDASLADTDVSMAGEFIMSIGSMAATLGDTKVQVAAAHGYLALETLQAAASSTLTIRDIQKLTLQSLMLTSTETFYNPQEEVTAQAAAELLQVVAYIEAITLAGGAALTADTEHALLLWLQARAEGSLETDLQRIFEDTLAALAGDDVVGAAAALLSEVGSAEGSVVGSIALELMDEMAAQLTAENTLFVSITETLEAEAGDSVQALGHYSQNVKDMAGAWLVFKVSGEVIQGWVMNLEGERPFSQYSEFDFNSMTRIGSSYFAATDAGLYRLGGDTDAGSDIDAHIRSMMLDFDTSAQKRVVAAYLGYTSSGTVVLKVRSVDDGRLVEHWYEAVEVTAEAPRAGYRPLGRGLKSRYWQFELANVDGADFEIDKLELQPIQLSRRV